MKSGLYDAHAALNRGFDMIIESLKTLHGHGVFGGDYLEQQTEIMEELRAGINRLVHNKLGKREQEDEEHYGKMRENTGKRRKGKQIVKGLPPKGGSKSS
jgi:hypothetical protein